MPAYVAQQLLQKIRPWQFPAATVRLCLMLRRALHVFVALEFRVWRGRCPTVGVWTNSGWTDILEPLGPLEQLCVPWSFASRWDGTDLVVEMTE